MVRKPVDILISRFSTMKGNKMSDTMNFNIEIPTSAVNRIKDKSHYDYNFYHIGEYGDWLYGKLDTVLQIYHECANVYEYQYGYFEKDKFIPMLYWHTQKDIFNE